MNTRSIFILIGTFLIGLFLLIIFYIYELNQIDKDYLDSEHNRNIMIAKAKELKQSSDHLTRFARLYVITGDKKYKDNYRNVLAIRKGEVKRPKYYRGTYWDLLEPIRTQRHPLEDETTLADEMKQLPYNKYELDKLLESEINSNDLANLEILAFHTFEGLFLDSSSQYSIKGQTNKQLAIELLHSDRYLHAKHDIMLPIDEFIQSLLKRTQKNIDELNFVNNRLYKKIFILIYLAAGLFFLLIIFIKKRILIPIKALTQSISLFENSDKDLKEKIYYNDEIGFMTQQFFKLKNRLYDERNMFLEGPIVVFKWRNEDGWPIEYVSSNVQSILGYSREEFINQDINYSDIIEKKYQEQVANEVGDAVRKKLKYFTHKHYEILKKNGEKIFILDHTSLVYDTHGNITHFLGYIENTSDIIAIKDELIENKNTLESYLNISAEIILTLDDQGNITMLNESGHKLLEYENGAIIGNNWFETCLPKSIQTDVKSIFKKIMSGDTENVTNYENSLITQTGKEITILWHNTLLKDKNGIITGILSSGDNISLRKQAEIALKESETKFRTLADYTNDWEYWIKPDGQYNYVSPSCELISGYTNIEFTEKRHLITEIVHPDYVGIMKNHYLSESQNKDETTTLDLIIVTKNGKEKWIEHTCAPIFEKDGTFLGRRGTNRDITRRKKYETDLKKFNVLIDQSPFSIVITDLDGKIDYVNPYYEKITGYSYKESIGQPTNILKSGKTNPEVYTDLWHTIIKGNIWKGEFHNKTKDGELFWESASISPIMNQDGQTFQYMAIKEDITDKKLLESQLHQSQKMEAIGQFAGGIAHDFNNILTAILGFTEIGLMDNKEDEILNNVKISSLRAASLVKKLLGFSRKQIIEPLVLDVKHLIDDLEKMLNRMLGENIQIIKVYKGNIPLIFADPGQIEQIIINLIVNARDAVNSDNNLNEIKNITVDLNKTIIQNSLTENNFTIPPGSYITISVSDTGCGMDKKTQKRIFEPFFTTKEEGKGTGLGLATVYGIIKQNKGYITVTSEPWVGTTFKIYWPIFKTPKIIPGSNISEDNAIKGNETIVLVEDDKNIITMVENGLTKLGYTVISYNNPLIALEEIPKLEESFDILISDVIMPNMNGKELTDKLSKIKPELKILYTSGYTDDHIVNAGILKKDVNFLAKPYNLTELTKKIKLIIK